MERIWQWAWDKHGPRYTWALCSVAFPISLPIYVVFLAVPIVAFEGSGSYIAAAAITAVGLALAEFTAVLPGRRLLRPAERWAAGHDVDPATALEGTYLYTRRTTALTLWTVGPWVSVMAVAIGATAGAPSPRLIQYAILGAVLGTAAQLIAISSALEAGLRPARIALGADSGIGDSFPRSRPTFATRASVSMIAVALFFTIGGAVLGGVVHDVGELPVVAVVIGLVVTVTFAAPLTVGAGFAPTMQPIRDLDIASRHVAAGDFTKRLQVVQDDDLGVLAASFNRMQAGLAERQRLQAAFGTYVDPALAARLLEQGDDVFTGERRQVSVMFLDIRDFTPFAEANTAEDTVARLNELFAIVVPAVVQAGGHINKFLGDGAMIVFGAPNDLPQHADAAAATAISIHRQVAQRFGGELRIGIGINTGVVIAGTIGGAGHLEFTLIGDTTNVAARVEQLTKTTGDGILLSQHCVDALAERPSGLTDRGHHAVKGKAVPLQVFALDAS